MKKSAILIYFVLISFATFGQHTYTLSGNILNEDNEPLSYATLFIEELGTGSVANDVGYFEMQLAAGNYHLVFQFMGYESLRKEIKLSENVKLNIQLKGEVVMLRNITVTDKAEDPAYAIMRKAIAKAKYHRQQIDSFSANVYIKGKGRLINSPFFVRKQLAKEGLDSTKLYVSETYSEVSYKRPAQYVERVISVRKSGPDNGSSPMEFVSGSFYEPKIGDVVSPLSPKAFAFYRFEYLGTTKSRDFEISKIRVIPRVEGEEVVSGIIYIVEDYFSLHSLNLTTVQLGVNIDIEQQYQPIEPHVWLPVSHKFFVHGKFWGFQFEYQYLASVSNYQVTLNPDLPHELEVIDEKTELEFQENITELSNEDETRDIQEKLVEGQEVTTKELKAVLNSYEKAEHKKLEEPMVFYNKDFHVDSLAYHYDSAYWANLRPIPLNHEEINGYHWLDSLAEVSQKEAEGDTATTRDKSKFSPFHLLTGARYDAGEKAHLSISRIKPEFNTVEGFNLESMLDFTKTLNERLSYLKVYGLIRYGFSSEQFYYKGGVQYDFGPRFKRGGIKLDGGSYVSQFNPGNPIHPTVNSLTTLFLEQNFMKLYQKEFVSLQFEKRPVEKVLAKMKLEWSKRTELSNNSDFTLINIDNRSYTSNRPINAELQDTGFDPHETLILTLGLEFKPGLKFGRRNDYFYELPNKAPLINVDYRGGLGKVYGDADFHHINVRIKDDIEFSRSKLKWAANAGTFLGEAPTYFMDFAHFTGNLTPFIPGKSLETYRLLDYYKYSTAEKHFSAFVEYRPTKLLLSQIKGLRRKGYEEYLFANYLATPHSNNYVELGMGFDNLFRFVRVEAITSFQNGSFHDYGFRIGLASFFNVGDSGISVSF